MTAAPWGLCCCCPSTTEPARAAAEATPDEPATEEFRTAHVAGRVFAAIRSDEFWSGVIQAVDRRLQMAIYEEAGPEATRLLFRSDQNGDSCRRPSKRRCPSSFSAGPGRWWSAPPPAFAPWRLLALSHIILAGGALMSLMAAGLARSLGATRGQALVLAEKMTADLRRAEEQFRFIFEHAPVGISWMSGQRGETRVVNPAHERITGVTKELRQDTASYLAATHPEDRILQRSFMEKLQKGELKQFSMEKRYLRPDGRIVWAVLTAHGYRDVVTGEIQEVTTIVDVTEMKQAQEAAAAREQARFRMIFELVPVGISWQHVGQAATRIVNPAHERITGVSAAQARQSGALPGRHPSRRLCAPPRPARPGLRAAGRWTTTAWNTGTCARMAASCGRSSQCATAATPAPGRCRKS